MDGLQHVCLSGPDAIKCKSCATHPSTYHVQLVMLRVMRYEGTAQLLGLTRFKSHLLEFILLAEPLTDEGEEETRVPREKPWQRGSENVTYYSRKI